MKGSRVVIVDEFRRSLAMYEQSLQTGQYPLPTLLHMVQSKLADVAHHIVVCHRNLAEHRCNAQLSLFGTRRRHLAEAERTGEILEQTESIQRELLAVQFELFKRLFPEHMARV
jgi:hypothetical protein